MGVPIPETPKTLLEKLRDGDEISQSEFYTIYREMIVSLGTLKGLNHAECDDLVQEVMILFFGKARDFHFQPEKAHFRTWFSKIIHGKIVDLLRKRQSALPEEMLESVPAEAEAPDRLFDLACQAELRRFYLQEALQRLKARIEPENYRIFEYYVLKNHSAPDTMRLFGISRNQLDKNKSRTLAILKEIVAAMRRDDPEMELDFD